MPWELLFEFLTYLVGVLVIIYIVKQKWNMLILLCFCL